VTAGHRDDTDGAGLGHATPGLLSGSQHLTRTARVSTPRATRSAADWLVNDGYRIRCKLRDAVPARPIS